MARWGRRGDSAESEVLECCVCDAVGGEFLVPELSGGEGHVVHGAEWVAFGGFCVGVKDGDHDGSLGAVWSEGVEAGFVD